MHQKKSRKAHEETNGLLKCDPKRDKSCLSPWKLDDEQICIKETSNSEMYKREMYDGIPLSPYPHHEP